MVSVAEGLRKTVRWILFWVLGLSVYLTVNAIRTSFAYIDKRKRETNHPLWVLAAVFLNILGFPILLVAQIVSDFTDHFYILLSKDDQQ